jgi:hypothetical protein
MNPFLLYKFCIYSYIQFDDSVATEKKGCSIESTENSTCELIFCRDRMKREDATVPVCTMVQYKCYIQYVRCGSGYGPYESFFTVLILRIFLHTIR